MTTPAAAARRAEHALPPPGHGDDEETFSGYGVMGLPFHSGHVLALRRFPASSIGPGYTSVWHRNPGGDWTFWQDQADRHSCPNYFSAALARTEQTEICIEWPGTHTLRVEVPAAGLVWTCRMTATPVTRAMGAMASLLPARAWRSPRLLDLMSRTAAVAMGVGMVGLTGTVPNGHHFVANLLKVWMITHATAHLDGTDLGEPGPLAEQIRLGDFWIPQRGVFGIGQIFFAPPTALSEQQGARP